MKFTSLEEEVDATTSTLPKPSMEQYPIPHSTNANLNTGFHTQVSIKENNLIFYKWPLEGIGLFD